MTDLDRLLELYANFPWTNSQCDEAKHLKSQLESDIKLANEYKLCKRTQHQDFIDFCKRMGVVEAESFIPKLLELESKLSDGDKFQALLQFIPKNSDGYAIVECIFCKRGHHEDCLGAPQNCCCGFWDNKVETPEQQIQSQHTNLVRQHEMLLKAIQDRMELLDSDNTRYSDELYFELQNLLESTKEKQD